MHRLDARLRLAAGAILFIGAMVVATPFVLLGRADAARLIVARAMAAVCRITRLRVRVTGADYVRGAQPCVAIGNQQSLLCYMIYARLYTMAPGSGIVARLNGAWDIAPLKWFFRATGNFMVEPGNLSVTREGMDAARAALRAGRSVWIGPEGTRWKVPGELGPFKPGAFRLAIETGTPIVPMVISPLRPRTDISVPRLEDNNVELRVLEPILTAGLTRADEPSLMEACRDRMQAALATMAGAEFIRR